MRRRGRGMRVVIYDRDARPGVLPVAWAVGSAVLHWGRQLGVESWAEAYAELGWLRAHRLEPIRELQVWSHGLPGRPVIGGKSANLQQLADALGPDPGLELVWFRACDVAKGASGRRFLAQAVAALGCTVAAHTQVISAGGPLGPLGQRGLVALQPGELPTWSDYWDGATVSTLAMRIPEKKARRWRYVERG